MAAVHVCVSVCVCVCVLGFGALEVPLGSLPVSRWVLFISRNGRLGDTKQLEMLCLGQVSSVFSKTQRCGYGYGNHSFLVSSSYIELSNFLASLYPHLITSFCHLGVRVVM